MVSLNPSVSKQHSVVPSQIFELEDGTSSYKDFAMSKNNRFTSAGQASKNIIQPPSCVLHYYNVPLCVTEETFVKVGSWNDCDMLCFGALSKLCTVLCLKRNSWDSHSIVTGKRTDIKNVCSLSIQKLLYFHNSGIIFSI